MRQPAEYAVLLGGEQIQAVAELEKRALFDLLRAFCDGAGGNQLLRDGDFDMRSYSDYYSRWRMQLSAKLTF